MPFFARKRTPLHAPPKGNLSQEEYEQYQELHRRNMAGSPEQEETIRHMDSAGKPRWMTWPWGMLSTQVLLLAMFIAYKVLSGKPGANFNTVLLGLGGISPSLIDEGEWWRLITASFLHTMFIDYLFNAWFLWTAGKLVEQTLGRNRMLLIFLFSGAAAGLWMKQRGIQNPLLSSAAVFGVIGGMIGIYLRYRSSIPPQMRSAYLGFLPLLAIWGIVSYVQRDFSFESITAGFIPGLLMPIILPRSGAFAKRRADGTTPQSSLMGSLAIFAFIGICFGAQMFGGGALGGAPAIEETFKHSAGWSIGVPAGYTAEENGRGALMTHPDRKATFVVGYQRDLLRLDSDDALEVLSDKYGLGRGRREKVKAVQSMASGLTAFLRAETPQNDLVLEYAAPEEILRKRALWIGFEAPPAEADYGHQVLLLLLGTYEGG